MIFEKLFHSNLSTLECNENIPYVGYVTTPNVKQSLWFYRTKDQQLYPKLKEKSLLDDKENIDIIVNCFNNQQYVAEQCVHSILDLKCLSEEDHMKCWNALFPCQYQQQMKENEKEMIQLDDEKISISVENKFKPTTTTIVASEVHNNVLSHIKSETPQSRVYHTSRMKECLSLSNLAAIRYYKDGESDTPCEEHLDYSLVSLVSANDSGLQLRHLENFEWVDCNKVLRLNGYVTQEQKNKVLVVLLGLTLADLLHGRLACVHQVTKSFTKDRISLPFFFYADPCGNILPSCIQKDIQIQLNEKDLEEKNVGISMAKNMYTSVNF